MIKKRKDLSDKTLIILIIIGIIISVAGLLSYVMFPAEITGMASNVTDRQGQQTEYVRENLILNILDAEVNLGNLSIGEYNWSENVNDYFILNNAGNVNIKLYGYGTDGSPFQSSYANTLPNDYYKYELVSCDDCFPSNSNYVNVAQNIGNKTEFCTNMNYVDGQDNATIGVLVHIPPDEPPGQKFSNITFYAEAEGGGIPST